MKLSDLRPCDGCGGPLFTPPDHWFHAVRVYGVRVDTKVAWRVAELSAAAGLPLAEAETALGRLGEVLQFPDRRREGWLLLCSGCFAATPLAVADGRKAVAEAGEKLA